MPLSVTASEVPTWPLSRLVLSRQEPSVVEVMDRHQMVPNYKNTADYTKYIGEQVKFEGDLLKRLGLAKTE